MSDELQYGIFEILDSDDGEYVKFIKPCEFKITINGESMTTIGEPIYYCPCCQQLHGTNSDCKQGQAP